MRLLDLPMIKNHSYMMYLKNVSYPDRLSDLNWIFTKMKFLLFLQISLPKSLRICLQNKPKITFFHFSIFWSHFWICSRRHHVMICAPFWSVMIGHSSPRNLGVHVLNAPFHRESNILTKYKLQHLLISCPNHECVHIWVPIERRI